MSNDDKKVLIVIDADVIECIKRKDSSMRQKTASGVVDQLIKKFLET